MIVIVFSIIEHDREVVFNYTVARSVKGNYFRVLAIISHVLVKIFVRAYLLTRS